MGLVFTQLISLTPWTGPKIPLGGGYFRRKNRINSGPILLHYYYALVKTHVNEILLFLFLFCCCHTCATLFLVLVWEWVFLCRRSPLRGLPGLPCPDWRRLMARRFCGEHRPRKGGASPSSSKWRTGGCTTKPERGKKRSWHIQAGRVVWTFSLKFMKTKAKK